MSVSGTTYEWPRTAIGDDATFRCPLVENRVVAVNRSCGAGGVWGDFEEEACGVVNEQLNQLNSSFNDVSDDCMDLSHSVGSYCNIFYAYYNVACS